MNKILSTVILTSCIILVACDDNEEKALSAEQSVAIEDQATTEAYFNEAGELSTKAFNTPTASEIAGGRISSTIIIFVEGDSRFAGASVTLVTAETSTALNPKGNITIDFGDGQIDNDGNVRKGKILVAYEGLRFVPGSSTVTTFDGYSINDVHIEGTRTVTSTTFTTSPSFQVTFTVTDANGKATFPDQSTITRNAMHTHTITFDSNAASSKWEVEGQASGKTRANDDYVFLINRPLVFKVECALSGFILPAEGEGLFTLNSLPISINYGDEGSACDNVVTVTLSGFTQEVTVND